MTRLLAWANDGLTSKSIRFPSSNSQAETRRSPYRTICPLAHSLHHYHVLSKFGDMRLCDYAICEIKEDSQPSCPKLYTNRVCSRGALGGINQIFLNILTRFNIKHRVIWHSRPEVSREDMCSACLLKLPVGILSID